MARESRIEKEDVRLLEEAGFLTTKHGRGGWPDRLVLLLLPPALLERVPSPHVWIEYKQPGAPYTPAQKRMIPKLKARGEVVLTVDRVGVGLSLVKLWQKALIAHLKEVAP